jgi:hypothetical protein
LTKYTSKVLETYLVDTEEDHEEDKRRGKRRGEA